MSFAISYKKTSYPSKDDAFKDATLMSAKPLQKLKELKTMIKQKKDAFDQKFEQVYGLNQDRFDNDETLKEFKDQGLQFSKEALSNLLGGIGYYYGPLRIKTGEKTFQYDEPAGLLTGCPSRSRFPRGFLWDEGFHLMLTCQWSRFLCMDILSHWFNSMKPSGWIAREQIRGPEAESKVPPEFIT